MSTTLEDRLMINYEKALDIGRKILIRACKLLLKGVPVADKFIGLSNMEKKRLYFNPEQIKIVESGCKLEDMDTSLLHVIIGAFGGIGPGQLQDDLKQLKVNRNNLAHDRHRLSLNKRELKSKLAELKVLYTSILNALKIRCNPEDLSLLENDIANVETQLISLEKSLDDHIVEKTHALVRATAKADAQISQSSATLDQSLKNTALNLDTCMNQSTSKLDQNLTQTTVNLNTRNKQSSDELDLSLKETAINTSAHMNKSSVTLEQNLTKTTANLNTQIAQSSTTLDNNLNRTATNLDSQISQSSAKLDQHICHATETIDHRTSVLGSKMTELESALDKMTYKLNQTTLSNDSNFSKDSLKGANLPTIDYRHNTETSTNLSVIEFKESILKYLSTTKQPVGTNDIIKALGLKYKSQINATLYKLMKENSIKKFSESPPLWQASTIGECSSTQKEEILTSDDCRVLDILFQTSEPIKAINLTKNTRLNKSEINSLLYSLQERGLVEKVIESPPLWQILESGRKALQESNSYDN